MSAPSQAVVDQFAAQAGLEVRSETVIDYEDWEAGQELRTVRAGRVLLCPTWDMQEPGPGQVRVAMDPGVAFGSGNHPTTNRCVRVLSDLFEKEQPRTVLDLGCGTGVLCSAALALGAERATAVDNQRSTADTARRTLELNGVSDRSAVHHGDARLFAATPADLLCCNIFYSVIVDLIEIPELLQRPWLLFSGLFAKHIDEIHDKLNAKGLQTVEHFTDERWNTLLMRNTDF
jgi:ribosomal protein L11 methyltransferase